MKKLGIKSAAVQLASSFRLLEKIQNKDQLERSALSQKKPLKLMYLSSFKSLSAVLRL